MLLPLLNKRSNLPCKLTISYRRIFPSEDVLGGMKYALQLKLKLLFSSKIGLSRFYLFHENREIWTAPLGDSLP